MKKYYQPGVVTGVTERKKENHVKNVNVKRKKSCEKIMRKTCEEKQKTCENHWCFNK